MVFKKGKKAISPFDEVGIKQQDDAHESIPVKDVRYFSLRAAIFMVSMIITVSGIFTSSNNVLLLAGLVAIYLLLWATTMRVWQTARTTMVNMFVNIAMGGVLFAVPMLLGASIDCKEFLIMVMAALGVTALSSMNNDYIKRFSIINIVDEFLVPLLVSIVSVSIASLSLFVADNKSLGSMIILSGVALGGFSFLIKLILKVTYSFSSYRIIDYNNFPVANKSNLITFFIGRAFFAVSMMIAFVMASLVNYVVRNSLISISESTRLLVPLVTALCFMIAGIVGEKYKSKYGLDYFVFEAFGAILFLMFPIWVNLIAAIMLDVIVIGYLVTYKRRSIFAVKSVHIEGVPLIMIVLGVLCLCAEALSL